MKKRTMMCIVLALLVGAMGWSASIGEADRDATVRIPLGGSVRHYLELSDDGKSEDVSLPDPFRYEWQSGDKGIVTMTHHSEIASVLGYVLIQGVKLGKAQYVIPYTITTVINGDDDCSSFSGGTSEQKMTLDITVYDPNVTPGENDLVIPTTGPFKGTVGQPFSQTFTATGGQAPYAFKHTAGTLPDGLTFDPTTAKLSGTPTTAGAYPFTIEVTDAAGKTASQSYQLTIEDMPAPAPLSITPTGPFNGTVGQPFSQTFEATGGRTPYTFTYTPDGAGAGLSFNGTTGELSGTPAVVGTHNFTVKVTDNEGVSAQRDYTLTVADPITITPDGPFSGISGRPFSQVFAASGGDGNHTFEYEPSDAAEAPLNFDANTATLSGTPDANGSHSFKIKVRDSAGRTAEKTYTLAVTPALSIATEGPFGGTINQTFSQAFTAAGGSGNYTYAYAPTSDTVPGLTFAPATATLSGTPTTAGTYAFTIEVTDKDNYKATQSYSLTIASDLALIVSNETEGTVIVHQQTFSIALSADGGVPGYTFSTSPLPSGWTLHSDSISGDGTGGIDATIKITVTDSVGNTASKDIRITTDTTIKSGLENPRNEVAPAHGGKPAKKTKIKKIEEVEWFE